MGVDAFLGLPGNAFALSAALGSKPRRAANSSTFVVGMKIFPNFTCTCLWLIADTTVSRDTAPLRIAGASDEALPSITSSRSAILFGKHKKDLMSRVNTTRSTPNNHEVLFYGKHLLFT